MLLRPRNVDNLGAIARTMKNFGRTDWIVITPAPLSMKTPDMNCLAVHVRASVGKAETSPTE